MPFAALLLLFFHSTEAKLSGVVVKMDPRDMRLRAWSGGSRDVAVIGKLSVDTPRPPSGRGALMPAGLVAVAL